MRTAHWLALVIALNYFIWGNNQRPNTLYKKEDFFENRTARLGDNPFPTNPMSDRARGYLLKGKAQTALSNYGNYIDFDIKPNGAWGDYAYLYDVSFLAGIPGNKNSSHFSWELIETILENDSPIYSIWESENAYNAWFLGNDTIFSGIIFNCENDFGIWEPDSISRKMSLDKINVVFS